MNDFTKTLLLACLFAVGVSVLGWLLTGCGGAETSPDANPCHWEQSICFCGLDPSGAVVVGDTCESDGGR